MFTAPAPDHAERVRSLNVVPLIPEPAFRTRVDADRDVVTLAPVGELDIATAPILDADLRAARDLGFEAIVVDLRDLTFIDSSGVHLLVRWAAAASLRGYAFRLIPGSDRIQLVFRINGLLGLLGFEGPRDVV